MRILIAEDDMVSRKLMMRFLEPYGDVVAVENGHDALVALEAAFIENDPYDLLCLDVMMPEVDGHEVLQKYRVMEAKHGREGLDRSIILMTTALDDAKNVMKAFKEETDGYLVKPINHEKLVEKLQSCGLIKG